MGIYTNGIIYGIRISKLIDDEPNIIFKRKDIVKLTLDNYRKQNCFMKNYLIKPICYFQHILNVAIPMGKGFIGFGQ